MAEGEKLISINIEDEMKSAYIDYSMSVIVSRALPDVRDGFKPVHRRVLYGMYELGVRSTSAHKKSARIVGEVLGKYHPHGDTSVYDSMVRMAQEWSLRYMMVDGQGNFGSVDGDSPAAMRYTEARMRKIADDMLADIDKATVENAYLGRQQISLFNLLKDTCRAMAPAIQRTPYKVILEFNDKNDVQLDSFPSALGQVFQNVINNALLHAFGVRSYGEIVISANRREESVDILFADNGVGMSSDHQDQVFDRFFSTKSDLGEMGLGMYIVKMLATKVLGGDVSVDSTPNKGTTVVLSVPLNAPAERHKSTLDIHSDSA